MNSVLTIASDLSGAGAALAGLILIFLGATSSAYNSYNAQEQSAVKVKYKTRARLAFAGFILSVIASGLALAGNLMTSRGMVWVALVSLAGSLAIVVIAAWKTVKDIS